MQLVKREPEGPLSTFRKEMDRFFDDFWGQRWPSIGWPSFQAGEFLPPVEVGETEEEVFVHAQVPGIRKENLTVQLSDGSLTIKGEMKEEKEEKKKSFYRQEFCYGNFARTVALPEEVAVDKATADLQNGVLKIRIPKTEKANKKAVNVAIK